VALLRPFILSLLVSLALIGGCTRLPGLQQTTLTPKNLAELQAYLLGHEPDVDLFRSRGPFAVAIEENHELRLSPRERVYFDRFLAAPPEKAPLVILLHGHDTSKSAHYNQAAQVASWGMHAITVQLASHGPWPTNARTLGRIVSLIHRSPELIDKRIDVNRIIVAGHSFGASAVAMTVADGAPAMGAILLDPAAVGRNLPDALRRITKPVIVIGADNEIQSTRNRDFFYRFVRTGVSEVSIRGAAHEDAQYPSEYALRHFGHDPYTTEEAQITFAAALTAAAFSLSSTGSFDYAWRSFGTVFKTGLFFNAKKK
jgi:dienelactone hydrolase